VAPRPITLWGVWPKGNWVYFCDETTELGAQRETLVAELRVLIVGDRPDRGRRVAEAAARLGHAVVSAEVADVGRVGDLTRSEHPDVALVVVGDSTGSLAMIERIVKEAACPVIAILDVEDPDFVDRAARLGIFAYIADGMDEQQLQSSMDIALRRFAEYHALEGAFGRRALTERAKGILMERHDLNEQEAFTMLRDHARRSSRKIVDVAEAVVESHGLLPGHSPSEAEGSEHHSER
jgi:AmiR/NasT family two-component response regulator